MRKTLDENCKLCNSCEIKEKQSRIKPKASMENIVSIAINCPREDHIKIEEFCINEGIDFSRYFLELHYANVAALEEMNKLLNHPRPILMGQAEVVEDEAKPDVHEEKKDVKKFKKIGKK